MSKRARQNYNVSTRLSAIQEGMAALESKTRTEAPDGSDERLEVIERKLDLLGSANYRAEEDLLVRGSNYAQAILDPAYTGPGPARVSFMPSGTLSTEYYEWRGEFYYWGNRVVEMERIDGRWFIRGHTYESRDAITGQGKGGIVKLPSGTNGWTNYSEYTGSFQYAEAQAQRLPSGIVVLSGLIGLGGITNEAVITTLPEGYRPDSDMIFPTLNGNNWRSVTINTAGEVRVRPGYASSFISLDGVAFPAAGVAAWTEIGSAGSGSAFANNWGMYANPVWGVPAYWKDPYGLVWFRGLLGGGSRAADNTAMVTLPATHRPVLEQHYSAAADDQFGLVGGKTNGLNYKNGTYGSSWISLSGVKIITQEAYDSGVWVAPTLTNSWSNFDPALFPTLNITRRADGLGLSRGLIRSGTVGSGARSFTVPRHLMPAMTWLTPRPAAAAAGRVDMYGFRGNSAGVSPGTTGVNFGTNTWVSFDGMTWMVGEL